MIYYDGLETAVPPELMAALSPSAMKALTWDIAEASRAHWIRLAGSRFTSTRSDYINGIQPVQEQNDQVIIRLVGKLPNMLENGWAGGRMHDWLLEEGNPKVKVDADGTRYRNIPFRHGTPGSAGLAGTPMGNPYAGKIGMNQSRALGKEVYNKAKRLRGQGRLDTSTMDIPKLRPHHTKDIYSGMMRQQKEYRTAKQGQYVSFRRISKDPQGRPSEGWIHPGMGAANLASQVNAHIGRIAPVALFQYLNGLAEGS